ncbi:MAG: PilT/PilU family type 4a pilus ATPase [Deltaproteobacteria bacterium]|nr:PilT/PilU family type 4a pilus ATPase [Deltaproteobacteria bacterium]
MQKQLLDYILTAMLESHPNVSDINITVDKPPQVETAGVLKPVEFDPPIERLTSFQSEIMALGLVGGDRRLTRDLMKRGSCDISYQLAGKARLRVNVFSQKGCYSIAMRQLPSRVPSIEELKLPPVFKKVTEDRNGLVLLTGATGTGKSTTLAALINEINEKRPVHIVTLEDPVEFVHAQKAGTVNQRELGIDFDNFASGLRAAVRQAPKVILVGEMRDRETVEIALSASETGHLVLSTLHTIDAGHTINRILGMFDPHEERLVRIRLADSLRWIVCQRLLPKTGGDRAAAFEIMGSSLRAKDLILHGETEDRTFYGIIEESNAFGMVTFEQSIARLFEQGLVTEETAISFANRRSAIRRSIDSIKSARGEKTTSIGDLSIDTEYGRRPGRY